MSKEIKTQPLEKVLTMTNTSGLNLISERNGKIYRTPFKEEYKVSNIEKDDIILFRDVISQDQGTDKILGIEYGEFLYPIIDPDNNPIYTERLDTSLGYSIIPMEKGEVSVDTGDLLEWDSDNPYIRSAVYIPFVANETYTFSCPSGKIPQIRIILFDGAKRIITDKWKNGISNYEEISLAKSFTSTITEAKYMMIDVRGNGDPSIELRLNKQLDPRYEYLTIDKIRMRDYYHFSTNDTLEASSKQFEFSHDKPSSKVATYAFRAPVNNPLDVKIRLLNAGLHTSQYVDIRSVRNNEETDTVGRCEIGIRSFEEDTPVPEFVVGFANTVNGELIRKLTIDPDARPIHLTKDGIQFRSNNVNNNKPYDSELVTINFNDFNAKLNKVYTSMVSHNLLVDQELADEVELVNIKATNVDYNSTYATVADALDFLIANNNYVDTSDIQSQIELLTSDMELLSTSIDTTEKSIDYKIAELNSIVKTYDNNINTAINTSNQSLELAESLDKRITANTNNVSSNTAAINNLSNSLSNAQLTLSSKDAELEERINNLKLNPEYPVDRLLSNMSTNIIYISKGYVNMIGLSYTTTKESNGMITATMCVSSNVDDLLTISYEIDNVIQDIEFKQSIGSGYTTVTVSFPIPTFTFSNGSHAIRIIGKSDTGETIMSSATAIVHIFEEVTS